MPEQRERLTAVKTRLKPLLEGEYYPSEGFNPAYVITTQGLKISRTRIMGTVMNKFVSDDGDYGFLVLDDETETIRAKFFQETEQVEETDIGDLVDVVGKVREYEGEIYINPEVVRKVGDPNMLVLRLAELAEQEEELSAAREKVDALIEDGADLQEIREEASKEGIDPDIAVSIARTASGGEDSGEAKKKVLEAIEELEGEDGAEYPSIVEEVDMPEAQVEAAINKLLSDGTCYEPQPGKLKRL